MCDEALRNRLIQHDITCLLSDYVKQQIKQTEFHRNTLLDLLDPPVPTLETASKSLFLDALLDIITIYLKIRYKKSVKNTIKQNSTSGNALSFFICKLINS